MKVLYISHTSEMHGSGKALINIIEVMILRNVEVCIILPKVNGALIEEIKKLNINYFVGPVEAWVWPSLKSKKDYILFLYRVSRLLINSMLFYIKLLFIAKEYRPDIIHTNVGVVHISYYVAKKLNIPHVWHIREYQDLNFGWTPFPSKKSFQKKLLSSNNYPIAITKEVYEHHDLQLNCNARYIYDGVFDAKVVPEIKEHKKNYFLFVGLISEEKGTAEAINAFLSVSSQYTEYELWIAGGGNEKYIEKLKKKIYESDKKSQIRFLGHRTDIYELMSEALALIVSSKNEGFGFITAEAMYNGCLVIGRNTAGTKEQFDNGLNLTGIEIGIRYNSSEELVFVMQNLCNNGISGHLNTLKEAQRTVVALYSSKKNAEEIYNYYSLIWQQKKQES